jgi:membrane-associated phospholipid phosphatase
LLASYFGGRGAGGLRAFVGAANVLRGNSGIVRARREQLYAANLALATAAFAALAAAALAWEDGAEADVRFVRWVHGSAPHALVDLMQVLTYLGSSIVLGSLALAAAVVLVRRGASRTAVFVVTAFVASEVLDQALKAAFRRARPELENPFVRLTTYSFPSGHAFAATATYGALGLILAARSSRTRRASVAASAAILVAVVAASRVILGVHYLLDVLAGIAGGIAVLSALLLVFRGRHSGFGWQEQPEGSRVGP